MLFWPRGNFLSPAWGEMSKFKSKTYEESGIYLPVPRRRGGLPVTLLFWNSLQDSTELPNSWVRGNHPVIIKHSRFVRIQPPVCPPSASSFLTSCWSQAFMNLHRFQAVIRIFARFPVRCSCSDPRSAVLRNLCRHSSSWRPNGCRNENEPSDESASLPSIASRTSFRSADWQFLSCHVLSSNHERKAFYLLYAFSCFFVSSGCLFKDNEPSICSLKRSVSRTALWSRDFKIIFFPIVVFEIDSLSHFLIPICCL